MAIETSIPQVNDLSEIFAGGAAAAGATNKLRDISHREALKTLQKVGYDKATVISILPWKLMFRPAYGFFEIEPPNKKRNEDFREHVIHVPSRDNRDYGERHVCEVVMPVAIAQEFETMEKDTGGVFYFKGTERPANFEQMLAAAKANYVSWCNGKYMEGQSNWQKHNRNPRFIDARMRDAAQALKDTGRIDELPEWVMILRDGATSINCPHCAEPIKKAANVCRHCGRDVVAGYTKPAVEAEPVEVVAKPKARV